MSEDLNDGVPPPALDPDFEKELTRRGIAVTDPGAMLDGIARRIVSNEQLCAFLLTVETSRRKDAYDALRERLLFRVESFTKVMLHRGNVLRNMKKRGLSFTKRRS